MFLAPRQRKTTVFTRFWASASKNHSIYSVLWPGPSKKHWYLRSFLHVVRSFFWMPKAQKHCKLHDFFTRGQYQQNMKNWSKTDQKTPNKDLQNASANFTLFSPTPNPKNVKTPAGWRILGEGRRHRRAPG